MASLLIVDDDETLRDALFELFGEKHLCHTAESAEQALEWLKFEHYDVVLTDISMPGLSGLELVAHLRQMQPHIPVIVLTGIDDQEHADKLLKLGAFAYLVKPFDLEDAEGKVSIAVVYRQKWLETVEKNTYRAIEQSIGSTEVTSQPQ